ncbi:MFS transporter [Deinococcus cellulosilyticus]|uniref:MFS transporter n=1 Tax=Deinococcus cellulosilyticus (strain DSM 18568 / NBRC 106333 / KACC 11606 / 5516J-15) TaxID=1223518 RepID=A0A511N6V6_DEIC1|nr:MFS transporter [Deinococcus cellulosilyticus]GEM48592.1 MFS transporter [Deinococcus cellulosilyticus NBRC 106333 = KACC 11606]
MLRVPEDPARRTMFYSLLEGSSVQIFLNWTTGIVLTGFMLHLGARPSELALVASVPFLAQMISPFAAWWAGRLGKRKDLTLLTSILGRALWVLAALLPLLNVPEAFRPTFVVLLVAVSSALQAAAGTLWQAWMGDVIPEEERGKYMGFRTGLVGVIGMLGNLLAGWLLDRLPAPYNFQLVLLIGVGFALVAAFFLKQHHEPAGKVLRFKLLDTFVLPLKDQNFRRYLRFSAYWMVAVMLCSGFVFPYFLKVVKMSFTTLALWTALASIAAMILTPLWGAVADRWGNKPVLAIGTFVAGTLMPISWMLGGITGNMGFLWAAAIFDALAWGAINPALFNLVLASSPNHTRASYFAMFNLLTGFAGFLGGIVSGALMEWFPHIFGATNAYHALFILAGVLRACAWMLLRPITEARAHRTRDVLRYIGQHLIPVRKF